MKKYITAFIGALVFVPALAFASFDVNLAQGARGEAVVAMQQFLIVQNHLSPDSATGYFGSLTLAAVKAFQASQSITPVSGYWGPLTRARANSLGVAVQSATSVGTDSSLTSLLARLALVQAQIAALKSAQASTATESAATTTITTISATSSPLTNASLQAELKQYTDLYNSTVQIYVQQQLKNQDVSVNYCKRAYSPASPLIFLTFPPTEDVATLQGQVAQAKASYADLQNKYSYLYFEYQKFVSECVNGTLPPA